VEILVMVHRHRSLINRFFHGSHTHKISRNAGIPLLVLPAEIKAANKRLLHLNSRL
jgi:nucleotide-binding universal stress UspA family protein